MVHFGETKWYFCSHWKWCVKNVFWFSAKMTEWQLFYAIQCKLANRKINRNLRISATQKLLSHSAYRTASYKWWCDAQTPKQNKCMTICWHLKCTEFVSGLVISAFWSFYFVASSKASAQVKMVDFCFFFCFWFFPQLHHATNVSWRAVKDSIWASSCATHICLLTWCITS